MKNFNKIINISILTVLTLLPIFLVAQENKSFDKKGYKIKFINEDPNLNPKVKEGLINTFYLVYPRLVKDFNKNALKDIEIKIDTAYSGVAYASNGRITISSKWILKKPKDLDVITHEGMHIVQAYPSKSGPSWLIEGIADYVRYVYGVDNKNGGWYLPEYETSNHYTDSYRVTARFLYWLTKRYKKSLVVKLDSKLREKDYNEKLWLEYTGKTLAELWSEYRKNPEI